MKFTELPPKTQKQLKKVGIHNMEDLKREWPKNIHVNRHGVKLSYLRGCGATTTKEVEDFLNKGK